MTVDDVFNAYKDKTPVWSTKKCKWGYVAQVSAHGMGFFGDSLAVRELHTIQRN